MTLDQVATAAQLPDLSGLLDRCVVGGFRADFLSWGFFVPSRWRNYWHSHSYHEVCLAYAGSGRFRCGDQEHDIRAGDVFLARPGVVHEIESSQDRPLGIAFWGFTLQPRDGLAAPEPGWEAGLAEGPVVSDQLGHLPAVLSSLSAEARHPRVGYPVAVEALGAALVIETARAFAPPSAVERPQRPTRGSQVVSIMQRHLVDNLARPIGVRDVAAAVHLSERHAERLFRQQTGASVMTTLRTLRLDRAAQLLLDTAKPAGEIARCCGYADPRAFRAAFRRHHGQSPRAFRANRGTLHLEG